MMLVVWVLLLWCNNDDTSLDCRCNNTVALHINNMDVIIHAIPPQLIIRFVSVFVDDDIVDVDVNDTDHDSSSITNINKLPNALKNLMPIISIYDLVL